MSRLPLAAAALVIMPLAAQPAFAQSRCGDAETVRAGETIVQLAERGGVSVEGLVEENPTVARDQLEAGTVMIMPDIGDQVAEEAEGWLDRARNAVRGATDEVERAAESAGRSVSDYLSDEPDLNRDILEFGERLGVPGVTANPERGAELVAAPASGIPGETVTIATRGLPGEVAVDIGALVAGEFVLLTTATTASSGRLEASVTVPDVPEAVDSIRFVVRTQDERLTVASDPFDVHTRT